MIANAGTAGSLAFCLGLPVCDILDGVREVLSALLHFLADPAGAIFGWLAAHIVDLLLPQPVRDALTGGLSGAVDTGLYRNLYDVTSGAGVAIAGASAGTRVARCVWDPRASGAVVLADNLMRFCAAVLVIETIGLDAMSWAVQTSTVIGAQAVTLISEAFHGPSDIGEFIIGMLVNGIVLEPVLLVVGEIVFIPAVLMVLYIVVLMVLRSIMLAFAVALAPVCVATAVFDHHGKFCQWWWDLFTGALMVPVVLGSVLGITAAFAVAVSHGLVLGPVYALIVLMGGCWFAGKSVHHLTWRHFSHNGITGAMTAVATTVMAVPSAALELNVLGRALGHPPQRGGMLDRLSQIPLQRSGWGLLGAAGGRGMAGGFAGALSNGPITSRGMAQQFDSAMETAISDWAATPTGQQGVARATQALGPDAPTVSRVAHLSRQLRGNPGAARKLADAGFASFANDGTVRMSDVAPVLDALTQPMAGVAGEGSDTGRRPAMYVAGRDPAPSAAELLSGLPQRRRTS